MTAVLPDAQIHFFAFLADLATAMGVDLYCVGGYVRDIFLNRLNDVPDIDCVLEDRVEEFAQEVARGMEGVLRRYPAFFTYKVERPQRFPFLREFDIATARREIYTRPGALPTVEHASISEDLSRRDFTINALALPLGLLATTETDLEEEVLDPFRGLHDLRKRIVRVLHPRSFIDDPTRIFRACRYAARIGGDIEPQTCGYAREALEARALETISWFRVLTEMRKLFLEGTAASAAGLLSDLGALERLPFVPAESSDVFRRRLLRLMGLEEAGGMEIYKAFLRLIVLHGNDETGRALCRAANLTRQEQEVMMSDVEVLRRGSGDQMRGKAARLVSLVMDDATRD